MVSTAEIFLVGCSRIKSLPLRSSPPSPLSDLNLDEEEEDEKEEEEAQDDDVLVLTSILRFCGGGGGGEAGEDDLCGDETAESADAVSPLPSEGYGRRG